MHMLSDNRSYTPMPNFARLGVLIGQTDRGKDMHPDIALARSRAIEDAIAGRYDNREQTKGARMAYDMKHAHLTRTMEGIRECLATDEDVMAASRESHRKYGEAYKELSKK